MRMNRKYVDSASLEVEIARSKEQGFLTEKAGRLLFQLNYNYVHSSEVYFEKGDADLIDEFTSRTLEYVCRNWHRYEPNKGSAFSWFTKMIQNQWRNHFVSLGHKDYLGERRKTFVLTDDGRKLIKANVERFNDNY